MLTEHKNNLEKAVQAKMFHFLDLCIQNKLEEAEKCLNECEMDVKSAQLLFGERERRWNKK